MPDTALSDRDELRLSVLTTRRLDAALARLPEPAASAVGQHLPGWLDRYPPATARTYLFRVLTWLEFCAAAQPPVDPVNPELASFDRFHGRFLPHAPVGVAGQPRSRRTRAGIQSACAELLRYLHAADVAGVRNRFAEVKPPRISRKHKRLRPQVSVSQLRQLADAAATDYAVTSGSVPGEFGHDPEETRPWSPLGPLIIGLLSWLGMRVGPDVGARNLDDVVESSNAAGEAVLLLCGPTKGGEPETWQLPVELSHTLRAWLRYRKRIVHAFGPELASDDRGDALLLSPRSGERITERQVRRLLHRCATRTGMGHLTPHDLRHAFAMLARKLGVDERDLQDALGHASIETTRLYSAEADQTSTRAAEALRPALAPNWPAPDDPTPPAGGVVPNTCGCSGLPWSVLTADLGPWGHEDQAVVVQPAPEFSPVNAQQLTARCKCGVTYPPGRPVAVVGFVRDGATEQFRRLLLNQGANSDAL